LYVESGIRHSARSVAFSADGRFIAAGSLDRTIKIWDVRSGRELTTLPTGSMSTSIAFLAPGSIVAASGEDGSVGVWDMGTAKRAAPPLPCSQQPSPSVATNAQTVELLCADPATSVVRRWDGRSFRELPPYIVEAKGLGSWSQLIADGSLLAMDGVDGHARIVDIRTSKIAGSLMAGAGARPKCVSFAPRRGKIASVDDRGGPLRIWSWDGHGDARLERTIPGQSIHAVAFSPDETQLAYAAESGDVVIVDAATYAVVQRFASYANRVEGAGLTQDSSVLAVHTWYENHLAFDLRSGRLLGAEAPAMTYNNSHEFAANGERFGRQFSVVKEEDRIRIVGSQRQPIATIVVQDRIGGWVVTDSMGRFDTNMDLSYVKGLHWIIDAKPLEPLPLEVLIRGYYQPRLLPQLLAGATMASPPPLATLNRVQPTVKIASVVRGPAPDLVLVRVQVAPGDDPSQTNGKTHSDVYDVRLFRDGQLVGRWPDQPESADQLESWRLKTHLPRPGEGNAHEFVVKLPSRKQRPVVFSAYAFNEDRVKSPTAQATYQTPKDTKPRRAIAYVVTIGADSYDAPARQLRFAVHDAQAMSRALARLDGYQVVRISLTSGGRDPSKWRATKANVRDVLARLAGRTTGRGALSGVNGARRLARVTPDDVVIVTFSGHGHTTKDGVFYLLPSDSGDGAEAHELSLAKLISSEELSEWLRSIDASQLTLIIDACHSAASVDQPGFKPGPMGDRGLGQLAYDKAMRVLAASEVGDVALESAHLEHGLLTYALVHDGLARGPLGKRGADLNQDGRLTLAEWLRYGEQHTPALFEDIRAGRRGVALVGQEPAVEQGSRERVTRIQTPMLFDFARDRGQLTIP
jgi:WD40 repeat protein